jgi:pantoate--beta-alanine ligase
MQIIKTASKLYHWRGKQSQTVGFIPTLGALHQGHLSLVSASKAECSLTVVSVFLNPAQFSANEDLDSYPDTLHEDIKSLETLSVDVLFLPDQKEMYQTVEDVIVPETDLFMRLEGSSRSHFFYGVTTIVAKLFNVIQPTHTFFGEKDAQQLRIIEQMIVNMQYPIILIACPTIRNKNGLALSSRNAYLTSSQQQKASIIYKGLLHIQDALDRGQKNPVILKQSFKTILQQITEIKIDYISIACAKTLKEIDVVDDRSLLISTAVVFNTVRLIDNFSYQSST